MVTSIASMIRGLLFVALLVLGSITSAGTSWAFHAVSRAEGVGVVAPGISPQNDPDPGFIG